MKLSNEGKTFPVKKNMPLFLVVVVTLFVLGVDLVGDTVAVVAVDDIGVAAHPFQFGPAQFLQQFWKWHFLLIFSGMDC